MPSGAAKKYHGQLCWAACVGKQDHISGSELFQITATKVQWSQSILSMKSFILKQSN